MNKRELFLSDPRPWELDKWKSLFEHPTCEDLEPNWSHIMANCSTDGAEIISVQGETVGTAGLYPVYGLNKWDTSAEVSEKVPGAVKCANESRCLKPKFGATNIIFEYNGTAYAGKPKERYNGHPQYEYVCVRPVIQPYQEEMRTYLEQWAHLV